MLPSTAGRRSARLRSPLRLDEEMWFEVDADHAELLVDRADPFAVAALLFAMREGCDLRISGAGVSRSLLRNLERFEEVWNAWFDLPIVDILAEPEPDTDGPEASVVAYSGGVDSAFSVYRAVTAPRRYERPVGAALMVRGMDIPLADPPGFRSAAARSRAMLDPLGVELVTLETNAFELRPPAPSHFTAMGLASVLHAVSDSFSAGVVSSTDAYAVLTLPLDGTPLSDPLLGRAGFELVHEGAAWNRLEKLRVLSESEEALANLRVCLDDPRHDRNCGRCRKCISTYISLQVLGVTPSCFDPPPSPAAVLRWVRHFSNHRIYVNEMRAVVAEADRRGFDAPWVGAARRRIVVLTMRRSAHDVAPRTAAAAERSYERVRTRRSAAISASNTLTRR